MKTLTDLEHLKKLLEAFKKGRLSLKGGGRKYWRGYKLETIELVWGRNMQDGFEVNVYVADDRGRWGNIGEINIDFNMSVAKLEPSHDTYYAGSTEDEVADTYAVFSVEDEDPNKMYSYPFGTLSEAESYAQNLNNPKYKL